jgi:hypothetical protein
LPGHCDPPDPRFIREDVISIHGTTEPSCPA